ncbi:MAG: hypothetical protein Q8S96_08875 [Hydrogenophaga sp.]|uniref:hypothetical protein n=1 Tax=Hydrogenophaga sp. TaxID=1904254 RepID=UPI0027266095|nr:hypothetical protein [Hydrogenophaga sp.]MDZ4097245.1 hypothetical protein [Methylophilaceae bacterium]MDO9481123.1 hypothetical protein [Hydrogenophaga sp.]MDP3344556.1 hypothetical protein [Hydrogenophaga sp.]MDP3806679.1 hypothetical protein [Hydrogenophaga sp.]MDP3923674.1 hypothetical protein [Hydrogenophaga sp.]
MKIIKYLALVFFLYSGVVSGQSIDAEQIKLINETASAICNTVNEAKGSKSTVDLEGEVKASLSGLAGKLVKLEGGGLAKLNTEDFEGLTREATASALEGDRGCRERIFNKMFDKIELSSQSSQEYQKNDRRNDMRIVQRYLRTAPLTVSRLLPEYVCNGLDTMYGSLEVEFSEKGLKVVNHEYLNSERCETGYQAKRENRISCTANLVDLDEAFYVTSMPSLNINCLSGNCISCSESSKFKNKHTGWENSSRTYDIDNVDVYIGGRDYVKQHSGERFNSFVQAFSRLVSGGSDRAFCELLPQYCES